MNLQFALIYKFLLFVASLLIFPHFLTLPTLTYLLHVKILKMCPWKCAKSSMQFFKTTTSFWLWIGLVIHKEILKNHSLFWSNYFLLHEFIFWFFFCICKLLCSWCFEKSLHFSRIFNFLDILIKLTRSKKLTHRCRCR